METFLVGDGKWCSNVIELARQMNSALLVSLPECLECLQFNFFCYEKPKWNISFKKTVGAKRCAEFWSVKIQTLFVNHEHANWFEHISISSWKSTWCYEYKVTPGQIMSKGSKQSVGRLLDSRRKAAKPDNSKAMAKLNREKKKKKKRKMMRWF